MGLRCLLMGHSRGDCLCRYCGADRHDWREVEQDVETQEWDLPGARYDYRPTEGTTTVTITWHCATCGEVKTSTSQSGWRDA